MSQAGKIIDSTTGGGDVLGPGSSTDNALVRWDGATGTMIQDSGAILDDSDNLTGVNDLTLDNDLTVTNDATVSGDLAVQLGSATANVHIAGGENAVGGAPLKIDAGTLTGVPEEGALEFDGSYFYWTDSTPERHSIGDVNGPGSGMPTTNNAIVRWDGTTSDLIQNSVVIIDDLGNTSVSESLIGSTLSSSITNTDNTDGDSDASVILTSGGSSGGDAQVTYTISGVESWSTGVDNSNSDAFTIANATDLSTSSALEISPTTPPVMTVRGQTSNTFSLNGSPVYMNVTNTSNTSGSDAQYELVVAGSSGGDCKINMSVVGVAGVQWYLGLDNSDDDSFVIGEGSTFGGDNNIRIDNAGVFQMEKGVSHNLTTTATDYNVLVTDYFIGVTDNSVARTVTLPSTAVTGQTFTVKDQAGTAASANAITIDTAGAETIDGAATATINSDYGALRFYFDGTNYFIY